jgi:hypothetical protein
LAKLGILFGMVKLKSNLKELDERRRHVNQLNDQIGTINARFVEMGQNVRTLTQ